MIMLIGFLFASVSVAAQVNSELQNEISPETIPLWTGQAPVGDWTFSDQSPDFDKGNSKASDPIDRMGCRPDFAILIYPVITMGPKTHNGSKNNLLGSNPEEKNIMCLRPILSCQQADTD
jgi:hypothetical protein